VLYVYGYFAPLFQRMIVGTPITNLLSVPIYVCFFLFAVIGFCVIISLSSVCVCFFHNSNANTTFLFGLLGGLCNKTYDL